MDELEHCQGVFDKFLSGDKFLCGFIVGVRDHWISCVLHRQQDGMVHLPWNGGCDGAVGTGGARFE